VTIEPLRLSFVVGCPREVAFGLWSEPRRWWPPGHTATGEPGSTVAIEPFVDGRFFERTAAGEEIEWGRIVAWEPPRRLAYTWHLRTDRADATEVEVVFHEEGAGCRVEIEHRGWDRLGDRGPGWRERNERGWSGLVPHFVSACAGA
jgi:uncharacterized protein YndB with AHSA1/START domain